MEFELCLYQSGKLDARIVVPVIDDTDRRYYRLRSLRYLVASSADAYVFFRAGDAIVSLSENYDSAPWRDAVSVLILEYFEPELLRYMPQGEWRLGLG